MGGGYKIFWTDHALTELAQAYDYLELHFTERELNRLSLEVHKTLFLISKNPKLFPISSEHGVRRAVILKYNSMYYQENSGSIEILSFFANRQNPKKKKF